MRIALVTREYPPETAWGGIGRFYERFSEALREGGHQVEVFTQGLHQSSTEPHNGVQVHRVLPRQWILGRRAGGELAGMAPRHLGLFALSLSMAMRHVLMARHRAQPFDLVEGHEHLGINALINRLHARSVVTVTRYHTSYHSLVARQLADWPPSDLIRRLEQTSMRHASARVAASCYIDELAQKDFPGLLPCDAIIPMFTSWQQSDALPRFDERERLMVFAGRLAPGQKNPEMAAQAFVRLAERFPEWKIEFAGSDIPAGPNETVWERCERVLARFPGRYRYHGFLSCEELRKLYLRSTIAIIPSGFESFGLAALEAMSAGCVPLVSDGTALPEVVGEAGVAFRNGSLEDLVDKTGTLMADPARQQRLSEMGVRRARNQFSKDSIVAKNVWFFEELLRRKIVRSR